MAKFDKKLSRILTERGLVSQEAIDQALAELTSPDASLADVLIRQGVISERTIIGSVADEMNIPPIDLERLTPASDVLEIFNEEMARYYRVMPVARIGNTLTLAVSNPYDVLTLDDVKVVTACDIQPVISTDTAINRAIDRAYKEEEDSADVRMEAILNEDAEDREAAESAGKGKNGKMVLSKPASEDDEQVDIAKAIAEGNDAPVVKFVNLIIFQAIKDHVSDIHIEPFEKRVRIRYRLDGECFETASPPKKMHAAIVSRIKVMSGLDIAEKRRPQDGKFQLKVEGRQIDFRVSILPLVHGEKVCIRILDSSNLKLSLATLGFEQRCLDQFTYAINQPYGMVLVTGPTGSGKSTTLYSAVNEVLSVTENITTVEDPVEYQIEGVNQVPVSEKRGLTFAGALRSILRQDPDTIMIGEIRDRETIEIAVKAALTGHLVFSTLHTNDAPSTITRMVDMGCDPFMVACATLLVAAQRLGRGVCPDCKVPATYPEQMLLDEGYTKDDIAAGATLFKANPGTSCPRCGGSGKKGRFAILETMPLSEDIKRIIISKGSAVEIRAQALKEGMLTLRRVGLINALRGRTTLEDVLGITLRD